MTTSELLATLIEKGPALCRAAGSAGISSVEFAGDRVSIRFAPPFEMASVTPSVHGSSVAKGDSSDRPPSSEAELDPLNDPSTYEDGVVPGYERDPVPGEEDAP